MLKKELRDTLRAFLESTLLLTAIPFILLVSWVAGLEVPSSELIHGMVWITVIFFSGYSGLTLFQAEKRDRGFEYMLTLPVSRFKIFCYKYLPRLAVLVVAIIGMVLFSGFSRDLAFPLICMQAGMVCLSLAFETYFSGFVAFLLLGFLYNLMERFSWVILYRLDGNNYGIMEYLKPGAAALVLMGVPLLIAFIKVFKQYDLRPRKFNLKPYYYFAFPVLAVEFIVIFSLFRLYAYRL